VPEQPQNWFDQGGANYARYRPDYPDALAKFLAQVAPDRRLAVDVGCGSGQFTRQLAQHFDAVVGADPRADQLAHAAAHEHVRYVEAPAERLGLPDACATLITAAQAAHWFDLPKFYSEVRRIAAPGAVLALVTYGVARFEPELEARFQRFYRDEIGPFWPPERKLVDEGYAGVDFPFAELPYPALVIERRWDLAGFLGYLSTWSAARKAREAGREDVVTAFVADWRALWGDPDRERPIIWPIAMRLGKAA
jgi:SAM-dependent methyltransferase